MATSALVVFYGVRRGRGGKIHRRGMEGESTEADLGGSEGSAGVSACGITRVAFRWTQLCGSSLSRKVAIAKAWPHAAATRRLNRLRRLCYLACGFHSAASLCPSAFSSVVRVRSKPTRILAAEISPR